MSAAATWTALAGIAHGAPGQLDPAFGNGGFVATTVRETTSPGLTVVNGGFLVTEANTGVVTHRISGAGAPTVRRVFSDPSLESFEITENIVPQSTGRLVTVYYGGVGPGRAFALRGLTPDGALDPSFGGQGTGRSIPTEFTDDGHPAGPEFSMRPPILLSGDRLLLAGFGPRLRHGGFQRFTADGQLDTTFGNGGILANPVPRSLYAVHSDADGAITALASPEGQAIGPVTVMRFTPAGRPDRTFGGDGRVIRPFAGWGAFSVVRRPDGRVVLHLARQARTGRWETAVGQLTRTGTVDRSFSGDGVAPLAGGFCLGYAGSTIALHRDGSVVAAGTTTEPQTDRALPRTTLQRVRRNGALDRGYGKSGIGLLQPRGRAALRITCDVRAMPNGDTVVWGETLPASSRGTWMAVRVKGR